MINPTALTKNNEYLYNRFDDRLIMPFLGASMAAYILEGTKFVKDNIIKFNKPVLIFHGK